jgi:hypothetical protein
MNDHVVIIGLYGPVTDLKVVGGFSSKEAAVEWAKVSCPAGSWAVMPVINFKDAV